MQIILEDVSYKKLNNLNFAIEDKKITGIVSNNIYNLSDLNFIIKNNIKQSGNIKYSNKNIKNKIGIISINDIDAVYNDLDLSKTDEEFVRILGVDDKIINKDVYTLSTSEKIKLLFLRVLIDNPNTILIDGILEILDKSMRKKILTIVTNLKKFYDKTIIISTIDIDLIYEYVDNIVLIFDNNCYYGENKFSIFEQNNIVNNPLIHIPFVKKVEDLVKEKKNINLGNNENVNELLKSIYREVR